nr:increased DNA methylation 1-like isoform X1 [Ipomoea batatas]
MNGGGFGFSGFSSINGGFGRLSNDKEGFGFSNYNVNSSSIMEFPSSLPRVSFSDQNQPMKSSLPRVSASDQEQPRTSFLPRFSFSDQEQPTSSFLPRFYLSDQEQPGSSSSSSDDDDDNDDNDEQETPSPEKKRRRRRRRRKLEWHPVKSEAEFCPDAIAEYLNTPLSKRRKSVKLSLKVKKHLLYIGWEVRFGHTQTGARMCYISPDGKTYMSLTQVCSEIQDSPPAIEPPLMANPQECKELAVYVPPPPQADSQAIFDYISFCDRKISSDSREKTEAKVKSKEHLLSSGWEFFYAHKKNKRELRYKAPCGKVFYSLLTACKWFAEANGDYLPREDSESRGVTDQSETDNVEVLGTVSQMGKPGFLESRSSSITAQDVEDSDHSGMLVKDSHQSRMLVKESDQSRMLVKDSDESRMLVKDSDLPIKQRLSFSTKRNILSGLIDSNVVLPWAKVQYRKKDGCVLKDGMITQEGIQCNCCQQVYGLSNFEAHANSTYHRPSSYIFLEDGRSLLDCQMEMKSKSDVKVPKTKGCNKQRSPKLPTIHDDICSICLDYGELLLCDACPSSFHASCLGLKELPPGDWFCPSCCCGICHTNQFDRNKNQISDKTVLCCYQCDHLYHVGCLKSNCLLKLDCFPEREWFCNYRCEQIFLGLRRVLGQRVPLGYNDLSWTLLKATKQNDTKENHGRLRAALGVMHECFASLEESGTNRDLVEDIIFSQWSDLNRLNFQGFYTAILERNDEIVTVATIRVHGEKVAEIPLIATLFKHRKLGMCRALMNQLEKKLVELGVQRLVLPALPDAMNTWTGSFGFSVMSKAERQDFVDNTFLNFNGTIMCQKPLLLQSQSLRAEEDDVDGNNIPPASEAFLPEEEIELSGLFYLQQQEGFFSDFDEVKGDI